MYIALRTGGGRGVYEIAGATATGLTSADLLGRQLVFELSPDLLLPSGVILDAQGGKHRLRIATSEIQIQRQLAAALMLPSPRRVNNAATSPQLLSNKAYVVDRISLSFTNHIHPDTAIVVPGRIDLRSPTDELPIEVQQRLTVLRSVWEHCPRLPEPLQTLVRHHEGMVTAGLPIGRDCEQVVASIQQEANRLWPNLAQAAGDPLPAMATYLDIEIVTVEPSIDNALDGTFYLLGVGGVPQRVQRAVIPRPGQRSFRQGLLAAYSPKCQVTQFTGEPALEAAHIYPYSEGGEYTNDLRNGLLLRADIHVLFDLGLLKITPRSLEVRIMDPLAGSSYAALDGTVLQTSAALKPSNEALANKWAQCWIQHG